MSVHALLSSVIAFTFGLALIGTWLQRRHSLRRGLMDLPNERSSHTLPTPRSGGVAIVAASFLGWIVLNRLGMLDDATARALLGGGGAIALIGYLDDRHNLSALLRFVVHIASAAWLLYCFGGLPPLGFGGTAIDLGWVGNVLAVAAIVWVINLFNFMDGIDGIAASEAIFIAIAGALVLRSEHSLAPFAPGALVFAAACAGFLCWNWPPAKIFMGDVGSGFLGFVIAGFTVAAVRSQPEAGVIFLILGGVFFVDATTTLIRRMLRGEHFYQAHRIHAYQWLARRFGSHGRVVLAVLAVNVIWLAPCALFGLRAPERLIIVLSLALVPLVLVALISGAGRREQV